MDQRLHILQHALGLDSYGQGNSYRNHFVTGPGSKDFDACTALVGAGLMTRAPGSPITGGDDVFSVTAAGRQHVHETSPKPPELARAQRRYREFLAEDSSLTFGQWLRRGAVVTRG